MFRNKLQKRKSSNKSGTLSIKRTVPSWQKPITSFFGASAQPKPPQKLAKPNQRTLDGKAIFLAGRGINKFSYHNVPKGFQITSKSDSDKNSRPSVSKISNPATAEVSSSSTAETMKSKHRSTRSSKSKIVTSSNKHPKKVCHKSEDRISGATISSGVTQIKKPKLVSGHNTSNSSEVPSARPSVAPTKNLKPNRKRDRNDKMCNQDNAESGIQSNNVSTHNTSKRRRVGTSVRSDTSS
eukprot:58453_1